MGLFRAPKPLREHVLVTGGSKGIGYAIAEEFLRRGARVTLVARTESDLKSAVAKLRETLAAEIGEVAGSGGSAGGAAGARSLLAAAAEVQGVTADVSSAEEVEAAVARAARAFGPVDIAVCNAGLSRPGRFLELDEANFRQHLEVNFLGCVRTVRAVLPGMLERERGQVVLIASTLAVLGFAGYSSYAPSKWAVRGFADCLRNELAGTGVAVSVGYPPDTETPGYGAEEESKPEVCRAVNAALGSELFSAASVARPFVRDIVGRRYHLRGPDLGQNLLVNAGAGLSPGVYSFPVNLLLSVFGSLVDLVLAVLLWLADRAARRTNAKSGVASGQKSSTEETLIRREPSADASRPPRAGDEGPEPGERDATVAALLRPRA